MVTGCLVVVILVWLTPVSLLLLLRWKRVDSIVLRHDAADATGIACFEVNKQFCKKATPGCRCTPSPWPALSCFCRNVCITWSLLSLFAVSCQCTRRVCSPFPRPISQPHLPSPFPFPAQPLRCSRRAAFFMLHCTLTWRGFVCSFDTRRLPYHGRVLFFRLPLTTLSSTLSSAVKFWHPPPDIIKMSLKPAGCSLGYGIINKYFTCRRDCVCEISCSSHDKCWPINYSYACNKYSNSSDPARQPPKMVTAAQLLTNDLLAKELCPARRTPLWDLVCVCVRVSHIRCSSY